MHVCIHATCIHNYIPVVLNASIVFKLSLVYKWSLIHTYIEIALIHTCMHALLNTCTDMYIILHISTHMHTSANIFICCS